jgi:CRP-like cAMP-binding protein
MASPESGADKIRGFHLFSLLSPEDCEFVFPHFREVHIPAGTTFIETDEGASCLFLIVSGIAEVRLPLIGPRGTTSIAKFGPGDCVGELSLARINRRVASATAQVDCKCLVVETHHLVRVFEENPTIGYAVYRRLSEILTDRLVATNMMLRNSESHT